MITAPSQEFLDCVQFVQYGETRRVEAIQVRENGL